MLAEKGSQKLACVQYLVALECFSMPLVVKQHMVQELIHEYFEVQSWQHVHSQSAISST